MKTHRLILLAAMLLGTSGAFAAAYVEAPVTISATVTSTQNPVVTTKGVTLSQTTLKLGNREILAECVARKLISSTSGWSIVCYYDSTMDGVYTRTNPAFRLRHQNGKTVALNSILILDPIAMTGSGSATYAGTKVSGTLSRRLLFQLVVRYQGYVAICAGASPAKLTISGTTREYYGVAAPITVALTGYVDNFYESVVDAQLTLGTFVRK